MAHDERLRRMNRARLRTLAQDPAAPAAVFCAHDPVERAALAAWSEGQRGSEAAANDAAGAEERAG